MASTERKSVSDNHHNTSTLARVTIPDSIRLNKAVEKSLELIKDSTWHGLPNIFMKESRLAKLFWLVAFLASFGTCLYLVISAFITYFEYSVLVKYNLIRETVIEFPAVTFCNLNAIDYKNHPEYITMVKNVYSYRLNDETLAISNVNNTICDPTTVRLTQAIVELGIVGSTAFYTIDQMLLSCYFNGVPCSKDDFVQVFSGTNGNCYTWNSGTNSQNQTVDIKMTQSPGISSGLRLELYVGEQEYQPCWVDSIGALVVVHNKSLDPLVSIDGIKVKPSQESNLVLSRLFIDKLGKPFSDCVEDTDSSSAYDSVWYKYTFEFVKSYRQDYCVYFCALNLSFQNNLTNCFNKLNYYDVSGLRECILNATSRDVYYTTCFESCPLECSSNIITATGNSAGYPTYASVNAMLANNANFSKLYSQTPSYSQVVASTLAINIFYDSNFYTLIEDVPENTFDTLVANIGGNMALFLAVSVLSLLEILDFLITIVRILLPKIDLSQTLEFLKLKNTVSTADEASN